MRGKAGAFSRRIGDEFFSSVSLLLHMDGSNGSTTFTDSSANARTITSVGTPSISTSQSKFGGASLSLGGDGGLVCSSYTLPSSGDWTVEMWFYIASHPGGFRTLFSFRDGNDGPMGGIDPNGDQFFYPGDLSSGYTAGSVPTGQWTHLAWTYLSGDLRMFIDGVGGFGGAVSYAVNSHARIGFSVEAGGSTVQEAASGYIDDFRITNGVARYTANFTPPTAPFRDY